MRTVKGLVSLMTSSSIPAMDAFVDAMIVLAVAIGFLVIFLSMYTTVLERTREIGVLKSLGAGKQYIVRALLMETLLICGLGIVAGIGLSYAVRAVLYAKFPTLSILKTAELVLEAAIIFFLGCLLG